MDVCHNIDGFRAVFNQISKEYPEVNDIKLIFGISKSKKLNDIVQLIENEQRIKDIYLVSRPHMRLHKAEDAYKLILANGSTKLRDLIIDDSTILMNTDDTQSDSTSKSMENANANNVNKTLDFVLQDTNSPESLVLICGSFFIMSDVKLYFGHKMEVDQIM